MTRTKSDKMTSGAIAGVIVDKLWFAWDGHVIFAAEESPLSFIEHHHWGLLLFLLDSKGAMRGAGLGAGSVLIAQELLQENPFGYGKKTFSASLGLTALLLGLNAVARSV